MKKKIYVFIFLFINAFVSAQTTQLSIGSAASSESFNDVKFDTLNGGTVKVGVVNNNTGTGTDCLIVRLNAGHQVIWQKTISNAGDDVLNRVIVCANGDYVVAGQLYVNGIRRGFVCRISSATGNIIWSSISNNSVVGEVFWDVIETANHNIALAGADAYQNGTNCFLVMLNQSGNLVWSRVSTLSVPDQFTTINQLPNGNLILGGHYDAGGRYNTVIMEVDTTNGAIKSQNSYNINTILPGGVGNVNSILETKCYVKNNQVSFSLFLFSGYGSVSNLAICKYDQVSKTLSGNVIYHTGNNSPYNYSYFPVADNDYVVSQSFSSPVSVYISRVTANAVVSDKKITGAVSALNSMDVSGNSVVSSGIYSSSAGNSDGYSLFSPLDIGASNTCNMTDAGTMTLLPISLSAFTDNPIAFRTSSSIISFVPGAQNTAFSTNTLCTSIQTGTGTGLQGVYYNGTVLSGAPLLTRVDTTIDFEFTYSKQPVILSPAPGIVPEDKYSVRWAGQVQPQYSETYTFSALSDDGVRLWVNGVQLIDNWTNQSATEKSGTIALQAGQKYDIRLEYYENTGEAVTKLYWSSPNTAKQIIPKSQLYPATYIPPADSGHGLLGVYFNGTNLSGAPLLTRVDSVINFELTYSKQPVVLSPAPGLVPEDMYSVRWTGQVQPLYSETYTFYTVSDDGVRLWVNGVKLIDNWTNHGATENSGIITLQAGQKYDIIIEYYENTGEAVTKLLWSGASTIKSIIPSSQLFPANVVPPPPPPAAGNGLQGVYYDGITLAGNPLLTRIDTTINFEFTYSKQPLVLSPAPGVVPEDMYSVRWTGQVQPLYTETYAFYTVSDDGIRLWVNGAKLIDNWTNHGTTENSGTIALQAGQKYDIVIEYYENAGEAVTKLLWSSLSTPKQIVPKPQLFPPAPNGARLITVPLTEQASLATAFTATLNPNIVTASQLARLQISSDKNSVATISVRSINGHQLSNQRINLVAGKNTASIITSSLAKGLYLVTITGVNKTVTLKLIVQ